MVWAVSLSTMGLIPPRLTPGWWSHGIGGLVGFGKLMQPPSPSRALPPWRNTRGCTSMHFGENQLSPGSIGISPLSTAHPRILPHPQVRASTGLYSRFTLAMGRSPGFGSYHCDGSARKGAHPHFHSLSLWLPNDRSLTTPQR